MSLEGLLEKSKDAPLDPKLEARMKAQLAQFRANLYQHPYVWRKTHPRPWWVRKLQWLAASMATVMVLLIVALVVVYATVPQARLVLRDRKMLAEVLATGDLSLITGAFVPVLATPPPTCPEEAEVKEGWLCADKEHVLLHVISKTKEYPWDDTASGALWEVELGTGKARAMQQGEVENLTPVIDRTQLLRGLFYVVAGQRMWKWEEQGHNWTVYADPRQRKSYRFQGTGAPRRMDADIDTYSLGNAVYDPTYERLLAMVSIDNGSRVQPFVADATDLERSLGPIFPTGGPGDPPTGTCFWTHDARVVIEYAGTEGSGERVAWIYSVPDWNLVDERAASGAAPLYREMQFGSALQLMSYLPGTPWDRLYVSTCPTCTIADRSVREVRWHGGWQPSPGNTTRLVDLPSPAEQVVASGSECEFSMFYCEPGQTTIEYHVPLWCNPSQPRVSPDHRIIVVNMMDVGSPNDRKGFRRHDRYYVYVINVRSGNCSIYPGSEANNSDGAELWAPDNRRMAFSVSGRIFDVSGGAMTHVEVAFSNIRPLGWLDSQRILWLVREDDQSLSLLTTDVQCRELAKVPIQLETDKGERITIRFSQLDAPAVERWKAWQKEEQEKRGEPLPFTSMITSSTDGGSTLILRGYREDIEAARRQLEHVLGEGTR